MRRGFSMITAIMFIVLVATLGALSISLSSQTAKQTSDVYLKAQAELLARSMAEFSILAITAHEINAANGCLNRIDATFPNNTNPLFDISVSMQYLGSGFPNANAVANPCNMLTNTLAYNEMNRTVMLDIVVQTHAGVSTEPIRIHRRTLQKP